ncbi:hypothetical protein [Pseudonocardia sp. HH130630-07]|uniref:hypothetical protein n=1 Tax=Pseudonocardia sp. HH130630-07 TaxID=1690815 RepID=UPI000814EBB4|nr:hypothetical protein [Pseudonocardia sp. HH130630-07]ANY10797.1 hypothetical protein AFB00_30845 [Pseudonocardia sp. HH130630-07]
MTAWASPGLLSADDDPATALAYVTVTFAVTVETGDPHPAAEPVDAIISALLGRGFAMLTSMDPGALRAAPALPGWSGVITGEDRIRLGAPGEQFYDGDLGAAVPARWRSTALTRGRLVVLVATRLDLHRDDRAEQAHSALHDGRLLAGQVPPRGSPVP